MTTAPATLIVPTRDRPDLLEGLLRSVLAGDVVPDEIVVVDQSARCDGRVEALAAGAQARIVHVHGSPPGASRARNEGARRATHERLLFVDDDVLVAPGWCAVLLGDLDGEPGAAVTGQVAAGAGTAGHFAPSTIDASTRTTYRRPVDADVLYAANLGIEGRVLVAIGGFDERLGPGTRHPAAEDNDLGYRLLAAGIPITYDPGVLVTHVAWREDGDRRALRWRYGRGQGAFLAKHLRDRPGGTGPRLRSQLRRYLRRAVRRFATDRTGALDDLAYLAGLLVGIGRWSIRP